MSRIAIVEDDPNISRFMKRLVEKFLGAEAWVTEDGDALIEHCLAGNTVGPVAGHGRNLVDRRATRELTPVHQVPLNVAVESVNRCASHTGMIDAITTKVATTLTVGMAFGRAKLSANHSGSVW